MSTANYWLMTKLYSLPQSNKTIQKYNIYLTKKIFSGIF